VRVHEILDAGMPDADPHPAIIIADMRGDRAQTVVSGNAAADLHPHLRRRQFDLVMKDRDAIEAELVKMRGFGDRATGVVHERAGQQQHHALAA
jgi:hypothetical protein